MNSLTLWERLILEKRRYLTSFAAFVAGVAVLIVYGQTAPSHETYLEAELAFKAWSQAPENLSLFKNMQAALQKVPDMSLKYDPIIAQTLLDRAKDNKEAGTAVSFAQKSLGRIHEEAPFHAAYSENSLNIEQGSYQEALQLAVFLKEEMRKVCDLERFKKDPQAGGSILYVYNLIRIASLQQKLANRPGEKAAWDELEEFLAGSQTTLDSFRAKGLDLSHYIAERKKQL